MQKYQMWPYIALILCSLIPCQILVARSLQPIENGALSVGKISSDVPFVSVGVHNIGKIALTVSNQGHFGTGFITGVADPLTGGPAPSCIYPYPGHLNYLFSGAFWIGAVVGRDTLVSVGADGWSYTKELWPDALPRGRIIHRSTSNSGDTDAVSQQDYIAIYADTLTNTSNVEPDGFDNRPHIPLGIEITQRSFAWSYTYAEDFVLFDYSIKYIGEKKLNKVYMGFYVDADVTSAPGGAEGYADDISGFKQSIPSPQGCNFIDTVNIAWVADNDGKQTTSDPCPFTESGSLTSITGIHVIRTPSDSLKYSFNWWISNGSASEDFGPRKKATAEDPFRDFGGFLGTPEGDRNKYYMMRHEEFDYDQLFTAVYAVDNGQDGWLGGLSSGSAADFADGYDTRYLLSFGPFDMKPGEVLPISFAYVAGEHFHTRCGNMSSLFDAKNPWDYYNHLSFQDLGLNATWASWIYDNPGYCTDTSDTTTRDCGKYRICVLESTLVIDTTTDSTCLNPNDTCIDTSVVYKRADTIWYQGDGIPDFRGAAPPPAPKLRVTPRVNKYNQGELEIRWNGLKSETKKDVFSRVQDFEGYRVYQSLTPKAADFVILSSFDKDDYNKYIWNSSRSAYELLDIPYTLASLKTLYGTNFSPLGYPRDNPFYWRDSLFYFMAQDWNQSDLGDTNLIHKVYPDAPRPPTIWNWNLDSARAHPEDSALTPDGKYFRYFEYRYNIKHLLPSQIYYVSVTAFDYGDPKTGLPALESSPSLNKVAEYPQNQTGLVESGRLKVIVYPNPYRNDRNYGNQEGGNFEGRNQADAGADRSHRIHFANLPHKCKIKIFSLDGDLIRELDHNMTKDSPGSMHHQWDMITRNTQLVVSGIYYYTVESEYGNQIGKLVIIM
ncbi:MAG: hypothetical protein NTV06_08950 [candidate division Zixibacteria bacterium]|nr:hypothetical protein [candidate division Zixibacteria bacterium]